MEILNTFPAVFKITFNKDGIFELFFLCKYINKVKQIAVTLAQMAHKTKTMNGSFYI